MLRCSGCGAPAPEGARACVYCRAAIATVHCSRCFHLNAAGGRHCSTCGSELERAPAESPSADQCPACKVALTALESDSGRLFDCARCAGIFVPHTVLLALLARAPKGRADARAPKPGNPLDQAVVYRGCPSCGQLMHRKNFGERSGVIIDQCSLHGVWFDREELPRILAFVESGGLPRPEREIVRTTAAFAVSPPPEQDQSWSVGDVLDAADAVEFVLEVVGEAITWISD